MAVSPDLTEPRWARTWSVEEGERRARARMRHVFSADARYVWSAPGLLNIVGEYTDISQGVALTTPVPHRTFVAAAPRPDQVVRITTDLVDESGNESPPWEYDLDSLPDLADHAGWAAHPASVLWALLERGYAGRGIDLAFASCLPPSAGLFSSTALTTATALAANGLWGLALKTDITAVELAGVCMEAANDAAGGATAGLAQHGILRGAPGEALDDPSLRKRARHVFTENERVEVVRDELTGTAPAHERFVAVGKAMYRSHASLEVDFDVSSDALNLAVDVAFEAGALGARLVDSGRGGSAVALIRHSQAARTARLIDAQFRASGLQCPVFAHF